MSQQQMPVALDPLDFPLHGSRLIEASAGTGKTFTIALLYVRLVLDHGGESAFGRPLSPPEILVVTFTDAATQELRERIRSRLGEAARCFAEPQERHDGLLVALRQQYPTERWPGCARLLRLAAEWMDEAAVSTIHSWCYRMLREHAFDSGSLFTQNLETDQSELLAEVVRDYWRRNFYGLTAPAAQAVASCYSGPEALGKALQPLLARQDADFRYADQALSAPESLAALLEQGGDWYRQLDQLDAQARAAWRAARVELEALLRDLRPYLNGNSYRGKDNDETFDAWLQALADWSEGGEQPANLGKFGQTRIKLTAKRVAPEHAALRAIDAWAAHQEERPDLAPHLLLHALGEVGRELEVEKQRRAEIGFDDLLSRLDRALQGPGGERLAQLIREEFPVALIDEFQDVSPQIVLWLQALHRRLATQGTAPSLMAIGDDWQSIYGWRGSSPELFIDFDRHFPSRGRGRKSALLVLETNYRSVEPIIRDGEKVLAGVRFKQDKTCRAFRPIQPGDHGVKLVQRFDLRAQLPKLLAEIRAQCEHAAARESSERTAVLLLSRRNEPLQAIQAELDRALPVKGMTIHRAKGLQAEVAIVVDDCLPGEKHPLRNALYAASGFFRNSYDQAMEDESLRLAYVAITRGVSRVLWYTRKAQGATALLARR